MTYQSSFARCNDCGANDCDCEEVIFKLIRMYSEELKATAWWVERVNEEYDKPDYYGPWVSKIVANNNLKELTEKET